MLKSNTFFINMYSFDSLLEAFLVMTITEIFLKKVSLFDFSFLD